ncbi:MAG: HTH domain-containing protein [Chloroflexota bacterium]
MNSIDAAEKVLHDEGRPMRPVEIADRMIQQGLWQTAGSTPGATIDARISVDIRDHGDTSRFQRTERGVFALRSWGLNEYVAKPFRKKPLNIEQEPEPAGAVEVNEDETLEIVAQLSFTDAAERILREYADRKPMNYRDLTRKALELGLIKTRGLTPEQTMYAQILTEMDRNQKRGEQGRFIKHGRGLIGLTNWIDVGLASEIEQHNNEVRKRLRNRLYGITPGEFEDLIGSLLITIGFESVQVTSRSNDGGIDVRGTLVVAGVIRTNMAVQAKRWRNNVQAPIVQQVRGSLGTHDQGLIITTSDFSPGARQEAERSNAVPVALMNGEQLVTLLVEHNIGISRTSYDLIELT